MFSHLNDDQDLGLQVVFPLAVQSYNARESSRVTIFSPSCPSPGNTVEIPPPQSQLTLKTPNVL